MWDTKTYPFKGADMCASVVDGQIFMVYGGAMYMYNIVTDIWIEKTSMPGRELFYFDSVVIDNL